jgi:transcriptional regulator with XRE-family HTH domain
MNIDSSLTNELRSKQYREAYVASQIKINLPFQIRALRKERGLSQVGLAALAKMAQPRISEIEKPDARSLNLETLQRVASGLDVGFQARFVSFGELVDWAEGFDPDLFHIPSFGDELAVIGRASSVPAAIPLEEGGPAGDDGREAAGSEVFDPDMMPCVARPETQPAGTAPLCR